MAFMGAIGGPQLAMMSVAMGVMGAASKMNEARATAYQYQAQATQTELQGRLEAVKARQEGNQVLETMNAVMAATTARSSAGGLSPFSAGESVDLINTYSMRQGVTEFSISRDNAAIAEDMSKYQAGIYRTAAANTMKAARTNAMMSVMGSVLKAGQLYPTDGFTNMFLPSGNVPVYHGGLGPYGNP